LKNTIWPNQATSDHQYQKLRGARSRESSVLGDFWKFDAF